MKNKNQIEIIAKKLLPFSFRLILRKLNWNRLYVQQNFWAILSNKKRNVCCPISGKSFINFPEFGGTLLSPDTGAKARQRLVWYYLQNETDLFDKQNRLLHVAPEYTYYKHFVKNKNIEYVAGDKTEEGYSYQNEVIDLDLTGLNFPDNHFDYILCNHVLEHIPDDKSAMSEMYRVLKSGGRAIITVPINPNSDKTYEDPSITSPAMRKKHFGQWDHVRFYGVDISERLKNAGFKVKTIQYGKDLDEAVMKKYGLKVGYIFDAKKA